MGRVRADSNAVARPPEGSLPRVLESVPAWAFATVSRLTQLSARGDYTMQAHLVSVIIPTIGRRSLSSAIASALDQRSRVDVEIIVVNDSGSPLRHDLAEDCIKVIDTPGRVGPAGARNTGLTAAAGRYTAFLDDDDLWLPDHLGSAVDFLEDHPEFSIYCARGVVARDDGFTRIEPVELMGNRKLVDYFFGKDVWRSRCRRVLTSTLVFQSQLNSHLMETGLSVHEDTWWLLTAEKRGFRIYQSSCTAEVMNASPLRAEERSRNWDHLNWSARLDTIQPGAGAAYLVGDVGRGIARYSSAKDLAEFTMLARRAGLPTHWSLILLLEWVVVFVQMARRRATPSGNSSGQLKVPNDLAVST